MRAIKTHADSDELAKATGATANDRDDDDYTPANRICSDPLPAFFRHRGTELQGHPANTNDTESSYQQWLVVVEPLYGALCEGESEPGSSSRIL